MSHPLAQLGAILASKRGIDSFDSYSSHEKKPARGQVLTGPWLEDQRIILLEAAAAGDVQTVTQCIHNGVDIDCIIRWDEECPRPQLVNKTALGMACKRGEVVCAQQLLNLKASPNGTLPALPPLISAAGAPRQRVLQTVCWTACGLSCLLRWSCY